MFISGTKNTLKVETTDYEIDQAANSIECMSDEQYSKDKMMLWEEIKHAKQLSQSRNLLQNGDFENSFGSWTTSNNVTIQANNPIFKGHYLNMSGARDIDGTIFPSYIYQKIDEWKLKPYTRYLVRGFVGSSKDLGLVVKRYGKDIDAIMDVPNDLTYMQPSPLCGDYHRCEISSQPVMNPGYNRPGKDGYVSDMCSYQPNLGKKHVVCHDRHQFDFHIDTGELDANQNVGIWVAFKISSPDGYATLGNLEVIEQSPLKREALERVKHREKKWNQQMEKKRRETKQAYHTAKQAIDGLFTNTKDDALQFDTTLAHIVNADQLVQSIPYVDNAWLSSVPGMNYDMYQELNSLVMQARYLYDARNVITNGDFSRGLLRWHATGNVEVQQMNGASVLVLSNWSAGVSQNMHVQHHHGYMLRVMAKKEGPGKGYVTLMDCDGKQETLTFTSCEEGYVTKAIEVFPKDNRVRIEIGETDGSFYIESIELNCMKGYNNSYNQNFSSTYDQNNNNYDQNMGSTYDQGYNNYDQNSGCTCNQGYNS
ncbi:pesticidial crystal protein [Bacillus thuringiensis]|uniref:pesticidial crystal protein n=1 Tax=Bacillus thuringiensis TaxID=1428 RepID=UPI003D0774C8